ncbi:hypothetical protein B0A55_01026 [Friedmanniomyces simplex]|uniref:Uncharacterized protein n=1 Tax=Friedmanniomyces simplex TaxID=329884 RepID=A0A4U0XZ87_9PEZI|nr:hypothetical protein B0A55_01026 [Friedmanniomyces simplex]
MHHSRASGNNNRRANNASLKLPSLPRFHPANYPSPSGHSSSSQQTPDAPSPNGPVSPRAHHRMLSDAQRQLFLYQREVVSAARAASPGAERPKSPRLGPLGSPGPVTPLELEAHEGYLMAGARSAGRKDQSEGQLVERLIREEAVRQRQRAGRSPADSGSGR